MITWIWIGLRAQRQVYKIDSDLFPEVKWEDDKPNRS